MTEESNVFMLPPREKDGASRAEFESSAFKEWVEELPTGNVGLTAKAIYEKLHKLNQTELSPSDRFRVLETILEPLQFVLQSLSKGVLWGPFPLSKRNVLVIELISKLHVLMIQGYKAVLDQFHHASFAGKMLHKGDRADALHRAFYFFCKDHLSTYQAYRNPKPHSWREIHGLYHYATEIKLQDKLLGNEQSGGAKKSTITDLYKKLLLMSCVGPYQLKPGEIGTVYQMLPSWVPKVSLINIALAGENSGGFLVDSTIDAPPRAHSLIDQEPIRIGWVLGTRELINFLDKDYQSRAGNSEEGAKRSLGSSGELSAEMLKRLMQSWDGESHREDERLHVGGEVSVAYGLESLFVALGGGDVPDISVASYDVSEAQGVVSNEPISRARLSADEYIVEGSAELKGFFETRDEQDSTDSGDYFEERAKSQIIDESEDVAGVDERRCFVRDRSVNGYCLSWSGEDDIKAHIGELIGVKRVESNSAYQAGVIRWFKLYEKKRIEFGVELISGTMSPVVLKRLSSEGKTETISGFVHQLQEYETLYLPPIYAAEKDQFFIHSGAGDEAIRIARTIDSTASFLRLEFIYLDQGKRLAPDKASSLEASDVNVQDLEFEGIWDDIQ